MTSAFYERFERHEHGAGLKGRATHYCAGCGHGLVHRYLAEAIDALGIQDRTVAVSPVGCSVFMYYYLDVGNTQAAHGRAPAVALGHKLAHPESIVVSYQGDGDLASIGLAEIIHAAQLGLPITVLFVNNAVYGMTGGQLAPTTLPGQRTATSPAGRDRLMGQPLRVAELVAQLDGPVHVERVALFDAKQRARAARAVKHALQLQVQGLGFAFVEVLAECPTHLHMSPGEAERWVKEQMTAAFPLGVKKSLFPARGGAAGGAPSSPAPGASPTVDARPAGVPPPEPFTWPEPVFDPEAVLEAIGARPALAGSPEPATARSGPAQRGVALGVKLAGAGGDGAQTAAAILARTALDQGLDATHIPSYGPESRGGTSFADVRLSGGDVLSPDVPAPDVLVAFNAPSLAKFGPAVVPGGTVIYDSSVVRGPPAEHSSARLVGVPFTRLAAELGQPMVKSAVALGALAAATGLLPEEALLATLREALQKRAALAAVNEEAFRRGAQAVRELLAPPP